MNPRFKIVVAAMTLVWILTFVESVRCQTKKSSGKAAQSTKTPAKIELTFNFYETLGAIAKTDTQAEGALGLASEVQDKATRIRAQLATVKAVIK
jgi:hypothetical protein